MKPGIKRPAVTRWRRWSKIAGFLGDNSMPGVATSWPFDLAKRVEAALAIKEQTLPLQALRSVFETMFFASLRTEERSPIMFHVVYIDPEKPDPHRPQRVRDDRWAIVPLGEHLPFTLPTLRKLATATDPRSSSIAVYHASDEQVYIWGLVDQGNNYFDFITHDSSSGPDRPGLFQASILGVGKIAAYIGYALVADLDVNQLHGPAIDALGGGPVVDALRPGLDLYFQRVRKQVSEDAYNARDHWELSLGFTWLTVLRRLLLRAQQYRHGGAILITPDETFADLNIKHRLGYNRLRSAFHRHGVTAIRSTHARDRIHDEYLDKGVGSIPAQLYLTEFVSGAEQDDSESEINGAIWFISLLSRVDGLVLLTPHLEVRGFGVEITSNDPPVRLANATNPTATQSGRTQLDYNHFGTRHRSMMRYCAKHPGSVGFVISQDGDVRVMTLVNDTLVVWENIMLRLDDMDSNRTIDD
jgi:hypothetical protein